MINFKPTEYMHTYGVVVDQNQHCFIDLFAVVLDASNDLIFTFRVRGISF